MNSMNRNVNEISVGNDRPRPTSNIYPRFSQMSEDYRSPPQSPVHSNPLDAASEISLYQSALDLNDARMSVVLQDDKLNYQTNLERKMSPSTSVPLVENVSPYKPGPNESLPMKSDLYFRDGVRVIDFVLAYCYTGGGHEAKHAQSRLTFETNLEKEGLMLEHEIEPGTAVNFVKIHAPWEVLSRYAEIMKLKMPMHQLDTLSKLDAVNDELENPIALSIELSNISVFPNLSQEELQPELSREELQPEVKTPFTEEIGGFLGKMFRFCSYDSKIFPPQPKRITGEFSRDKEFLFDIPHNKDEFFATSLRSRVVEFIIKRKRFSNSPRSQFAFGITRLLADGIYTAAYPLHEGEPDSKTASDMRTLLRYEWGSLARLHKTQPLDYIKDYFGVMIGLYFAWLGFYTYMLIPASIMGLLCFSYGLITMSTFVPSNDICNKNASIIMCPVCDRCEYWRLEETCVHSRFTYLVDNPAMVVFAIFMSFWGAVFLELWKRYSATITYNWDLTGFDQSEEHPRPEYLVRLSTTSKTRMNPTTSTIEPYIPFWRKKFPAVVMSISIVLLLVTVAVASVIGVIFYRISINAAISLQYDAADDKNLIDRNAPLITTATAAVINLVCIMLLNQVYSKVAEWLTELEMPRTQSEYDDSLTLKMFLLQFVNYYASIFYIAFFKGKLIGYPGSYERMFGFRQEECGPGGCLMELAVQLSIIMVGKQALNGIMEMAKPILLQWYNACRTKFRPVEGPEQMLPSWERDFKLVDMGSQGLFWEYLEMVLQFGFVTIFVAAFPLAPMFALVNNSLEMRLDAKKFLNMYRRPVARRIQSIGVWYRIMDCIGKLSVVTNAFIIAFTSNFIPQLVYKHTISPDGTLTGFLNQSLSYFNINDFEKGYNPKGSLFSENITTCRYEDYREPPDAPNKYEHTAFFWYLLVIRLAFIVVFENVVMLAITLLRWLVPDIPRKVQEKMRRDAYLSNEIIVEHEYLRARRLAEMELKSSKQGQTEGATGVQSDASQSQPTSNALLRKRNNESVV